MHVGDWVIISGFAAPTILPHRRACFPGYGRADQRRRAAVHHGRQRLAGPPARHQQRRLKRRGFDSERIAAIKRAYRTLYVAGLPLAEAKLQLAEQAKDSEDVRALLDFIESGERPLLR